MLPLRRLCPALSRRLLCQRTVRLPGLQVLPDTEEGELTPEEIAILRKTPLVFGCDECQRCCPHMPQVPVTPIPEFKMRRQARLTAWELEI
jgi:epoxyqueuosine reductase QueG